MDKSLVVAVVAALIYLALDYGKYYMTNDKQKTYKLSEVIPNMIIMFILSLIFLYTFKFDTKGSTTPTESISKEPWE